MEEHSPIILTNNDVIVSEELPATSLTSQILKRTGTIAYNAATSKIGRKTIFTGLLYAAGGTIISTVGLGPVLVVGALVWLL